ncbi:hypothetical protein AVEN_271801-1 [Araneus ventricosus]|uniref:Uncharacterized protein n=1 Tax=Araneus ventricosus TaxID=182803 RepID=A0A4Y2V0W1_ARAVE|nr:hypothetical protein AVEN_271801-1 [Araneus ventricosus]
MRNKLKPVGVFYPKLSSILLEKGAVSPPPAWIQKFEPIVTQDPMTIRKYFGKESNSKRCVPIKCVPISTLAGSRTKLAGQGQIILTPTQIATCTHAHGESDEKKLQSGVNKYRVQKIASSMHACGDGGFGGDAIIQTDRQSNF